MENIVRYLVIILVYSSNALIGVYTGKLGLLGFTNPNKYFIPLILFGSATALSVIFAGKYAHFEVQQHQIIISLLILVIGNSIGNFGKRRTSARSWSKIQPELKLHSGKSLHIDYEEDVESLYEIVEQVCEALDRVGFKTTHTTASREALRGVFIGRMQHPTSDLTIQLYTGEYVALIDSTTFCYDVALPATGKMRKAKVFGVNRTVQFLLNSILNCLEQDQRVS